MLYENIASLTHSLEDLFYMLREQNPTDLDCSKLSDIVLESIDFIKGEIDKIKKGIQVDGTPLLIIEKAQEFIQGYQKSNGTIQSEDSIIEMEEQKYYVSQNRSVETSVTAGFKAVLHFTKDCGMENIRAFTGQHGKGFAVVAEEVRNLAARSANAAKETTDLIEGSNKKVEGGTTLANKTALALNKIVEEVSKATELVGQIATASNEQAAGIDQVNQGIAQVSQVTQTNSATSEESAAASEELSSQAEALKEQVAKFNLRKARGQSMGHQSVLSPEVLR